MKMTSILARYCPEVNGDGRIYRLNQHLAAIVSKFWKKVSSLLSRLIVIKQAIPFANSASLGGFSLGVAFGWSSSAGEIFRNILDASGTEIGLIAGILNAGACVGVIFMPFFMRYFPSRITAMSLTVPGFIVGWTFICCAGQNVCHNVEFRQNSCLRITDWGEINARVN